jgi:formamidopyrimidine-DNA glycosylase
MELVERYHEKDLDSIKILGVEVNDPTLSSKYLAGKFKNKKSPIKSVLLDQSVITGLGNIYVDETLFLAKIHPLTYASELNIYQIERIIKAAQKTIKKAIELGGTTIRTYQSSLGVNGLFQNELNVHTLVGHNCKNCDDTIVKIKVGGRGTYLCPTCQRQNKPLILGLTGGIASGKSLVSKMFEEHNIKVLDADKIYKTLLKNNKIMYNKLITYFGNSIIENDEINRKELGRIIFNDEKSRLMLNKITHPFVLKEMQYQISDLTEKKVDIIVLDIPLLFEAKMEYLCDLIILVYTSKHTQINRLASRDNITEELAIKKINSQMSMSEKQLLSDIIIDNSNSTKETKEQFNELLRNLRRD